MTPSRTLLACLAAASLQSVSAQAGIRPRPEARTDARPEAISPRAGASERGFEGVAAVVRPAAAALGPRDACPRDAWKKSQSLPMRFEKLGGGDVAWNVGTEKPTATVVYLHGWYGEPKGASVGPVKALARAGASLRIVAPRLGEPGRGNSMSGNMALARAAVERAVAESGGPVILMGHSFGGKAALALGKELGPDKVMGVVGFAPSVKMLHGYWSRNLHEGPKGSFQGLPPRAEMVERLAELGRLARTEHDSAEGWDHDKRNAANDKMHWAWFLGDLAAHFDEPALETGLTTPTVVFHGENDGAVSINYARRLERENPGVVKLVTYAETGHGIGHDEQADDVAQKTLAFIAERVAAGRTR